MSDPKQDNSVTADQLADFGNNIDMAAAHIMVGAGLMGDVGNTSSKISLSDEWRKQIPAYAHDEMEDFLTVVNTYMPGATVTVDMYDLHSGIMSFDVEATDKSPDGSQSLQMSWFDKNNSATDWVVNYDAGSDIDGYRQGPFIPQANGWDARGPDVPHYKNTLGDSYTWDRVHLTSGGIVPEDGSSGSITVGDNHMSWSSDSITVGGIDFTGISPEVADAANPDTPADVLTYMMRQQGPSPIPGL